MNGTEGQNEQYLNWVRTKHSYQAPVFVEHLLNECAAEFRAHGLLSDDQRSEIYMRVRQTLEKAYDASLRKHSRVSCCS